MDGVFAQLRPRFMKAAERFEAARARLIGVHTLTDAANVDSTGDTVAVWHERRAAAQEMADVVDLLKVFGVTLAPMGWETSDLIVACAPVRWDHIVTVVHQARTLPLEGAVKRFEAICDAGYRLDMVSSSQEWRERRAEITSGGVSVSADDDDSDDDLAALTGIG